MNKSIRRQFLSAIAIFILFPVLIGILLYCRMQSVLHSYTENHVEMHAASLTEQASILLSNRMDELERVAGYFRDGIVPEENMGSSARRLLPNVNSSSLGIVRLGGVPVSGQYLPFPEYPAVQNAFRGKSTVRYRQNEGIIFTAPIYNNGNVKYVLYEFMDEKALFENFGETYFSGQAAYILADSAEQIVIPHYGQTVIRQNGIKITFNKLAADMMRAGFGTACLTVNGDKIFVFVSELKQSNLFLCGVVPYQVAAEDLASLFRMITLVFGILLILFGISTVRIVKADAKVRESDALRQAKQSAEEAYNSKSRFLASMSHELRTPINVIMGVNEMILRQSSDPETREWAMNAKSASQILLSLVNNVLDFSKIESGMLTILPGEYQLLSLVRDLTLLSENRARTKSLEFELDVQSDLPNGLMGDDLRIQQVLTNLLTNALKYTQEGVVTLHISQKSREGDTVVLHCAVSDTGSGIKPGDINKLMKLTPFTRVDEERNRKVEGSGLGLPIIINLLNMMGSELQVKSVYGKGSTFWFDLEQRITDESPIGNVRERMDSEVTDYEYHVTCCAPQARVMVVDDNAMNRKIFVNLLKPTQIQVASVSSGAKCLKLAQQESFDLIFMDHLMPEMDGMETLKRLRALPNNLCENTPVIALTANVYNGAQEQYMALGFDAFLAKPIVPEKLENLLLRMLPPEYLQNPPASHPQPETEASPENETLPDIEGVDWPVALLHLRNNSQAWDALGEFYKSLDGEQKTIRALASQIADEDSLKNYRTRVHALKSTAALVGVLSVSELARLLESAAIAQNTDRIQMLTPVLLELIETMQERIRPFMEEPPKPKEEMTDVPLLLTLLETLRAVLENMDIGTADVVMQQLNHYSYRNTVLQAAIDELSAQIAQVDWEQATATLNRILSMPELKPE